MHMIQANMDEQIKHCHEALKICIGRIGSYNIDHNVIFIKLN